MLLLQKPDYFRMSASYDFGSLTHPRPPTDTYSLVTCTLPFPITITSSDPLCPRKKKCCTYHFLTAEFDFAADGSSMISFRNLAFLPCLCSQATREHSIFNLPARSAIVVVCDNPPWPHCVQLVFSPFAAGRRPLFSKCHCAGMDRWFSLIIERRPSVCTFWSRIEHTRGKCLFWSHSYTEEWWMNDLRATAWWLPAVELNMGTVNTNQSWLAYGNLQTFILIISPTMLLGLRAWD